MCVRVSPCLARACACVCVCVRARTRTQTHTRLRTHLHALTTHAGNVLDRIDGHCRKSEGHSKLLGGLRCCDLAIPPHHPAEAARGQRERHRHWLHMSHATPAHAHSTHSAHTAHTHTHTHTHTQLNTRDGWSAACKGTPGANTPRNTWPSIADRTLRCSILTSTFCRRSTLARSRSFACRRVSGAGRQPPAPRLPAALAARDARSLAHTPGRWPRTRTPRRRSRRKASAPAPAPACAGPRRSTPGAGRAGPSCLPNLPASLAPGRRSRGDVSGP